MIHRAETTTRPALEKSKFIPDRFAKRLGYKLVRKRLESDVAARLVRNLTETVIELQTGMKRLHELACIAHEDLHFHFHPAYESFRMQDGLMESKEEGQAEMYAGIVLVPSLEGFYTEDEFLMTCGLPATVAFMRLQFFKKYGC